MRQTDNNDVGNDFPKHNSNVINTIIAGLSLRAGSREFSPATTSLGPGYLDTKRKYCKEKNASNYKIMS